VSTLDVDVASIVEHGEPREQLGARGMTSPASKDTAAGRLALGQRLAALRKAAGFTQHTLAPHTNYVRSTVANVERGRQDVDRGFWVTCDRVLGTDNELVEEYDRLRQQARANARAATTPALRPGSDTALPAYDPTSLLTGARPTTVPGAHHLQMYAPAGRVFLGATIEAHVHPAVDDGHVLATVPDGYDHDPFLHQPRRGLVLGRTIGEDGPHFFALDRLHARRKLRDAPAGARLVFPHAYELDEITLALIWAVANLDESLLADDALLEYSRRGLTGYEALATSAASRDVAPDLTASTHMWLGSAFCAGHILRHAASLQGLPVFWTREQRGEEAATWLLFAHKQQYLLATAEQFPGAVRAFCIPRDAVDSSPTGERTLLLLTIALMESYGIHVVITDASEYTCMPGFVHDRARRAIVANWFGADGIWHVDVTDRRPTLREYSDAADYATAHAVNAGSSPQVRLQAAADYLGLNWARLIRRCQGLADYGTAGIVQPRSRHLSLAGVDRACQYVASAGPASN
jgi:hypothetical protein